MSLLSRFAPKELPLTRHEREIAPEGGSIEEGLLTRLFEICPPETKHAIEFGACRPENVLCRHLIHHMGFSALLIEADPEAVTQLQKVFGGTEGVTVVRSFVTAENIDELLEGNGAPSKPDLLIVDIDGNDYHVWKAIGCCRPTFVCIEFNASRGPEERFVQPYDPEYVFDGTDYFGASITSMVDLGREKGYELIHCDSGGANLFFVVAEKFPLFEIADNSPAAIYQLPQYGRHGRAMNGKGHPVSARDTTWLQRMACHLRYHLLAPLRFLVKRKMKARRKGRD